MAAFSDAETAKAPRISNKRPRREEVGRSRRRSRSRSKLSRGDDSCAKQVTVSRYRDLPCGMARRHRRKRYSVRAKIADFPAAKISYAPTSAIDIEGEVAWISKALKRSARWTRAKVICIFTSVSFASAAELPLITDSIAGKSILTIVQLILFTCTVLANAKTEAGALFEQSSRI